MLGRPAIVFHTSLHACALNKPALRKADLDDRQPDPADGRNNLDTRLYRPGEP